MLACAQVQEFDAMLAALPLIAAALLTQPAGQARLQGDNTPACKTGIDDQFVTFVPRTPAVGNKGLLRLVGGEAAPSGVISLDTKPSPCIVRAQVR
jgi:hypothetical protein